MAVNLAEVVWSVPSIQNILAAQREAAAQMVARQGATSQQQAVAAQQLTSQQQAALNQNAAQQMVDRQFSGSQKPLYAMSPQELWAGIQEKLPDFQQRMAAAKERWLAQNVERPGNDRTQWDLPELLSLVEQMPDGASLGINGAIPRWVTPDILKKLYGLLHEMPGYTPGYRPYASIEEMVAKEAEQTRLLQERGVSQQVLAARQQYLDSTTPEQRWQSLLDQQDASLANAFRDGAKIYNQLAQRDIDQNNYMRAKDNPNDPSKFNGGPAVANNNPAMLNSPSSAQSFLSDMSGRRNQQQNVGWNTNTGSFYAPSEGASQIIRQQQALDDYARTGKWNYAGMSAPTEMFTGDFIRDVASQEAWGKNLAPMPTLQQFTSQATDPSGRSYSQYDTAGYDKAMADWRNQALASFMDYRQQGNQGWQNYGDPAVNQWMDQQKQTILDQGRQRAITRDGQPIEWAAKGAINWGDMILAGTNTKGTPLTDGNLFQGIHSILYVPGIDEAMPWVAQLRAANPEKTVPNWLSLSTEQRQNAQYQWARQGAEMLRQYAAQNPNWKQAIQAAGEKASNAYAEQQFNDWMQSTGQPALDQYRQQGLAYGMQGGDRRSFLEEQRMRKPRGRDRQQLMAPQPPAISRQPAIPQAPMTQPSVPRAPLPSVAPRTMTTVAPQQVAPRPAPQISAAPQAPAAPQIPTAAKPPELPAMQQAAAVQNVSRQQTLPAMQQAAAVQNATQTQSNAMRSVQPPLAPPPTSVQQVWDQSKQPNATTRQRWGLQ